MPGGCAAGSAQELWLKADLAANASKNVIAVWHKPRFSSGVTNYTTLQAFYNDIYDAGVDILLDGHDHIYERLAPMDPTGAADPTYGIRQFTVGTGGAALQSYSPVLPTSQTGSGSTYGVLKLTLHTTGYDWVFLPMAGQTFTDSGSGSVHAAPPTSNNPPVAVADASSTPQDTALNVSAPGVLGNDTDADSDPLTAVLNVNVTHGTLTLNANGGFTYTPNGGYNGPDSFTYHANDGTANSNIVTVSLTVTAQHLLRRQDERQLLRRRGRDARRAVLHDRQGGQRRHGRPDRPGPGRHLRRDRQRPNSGTAGNPITFSAAPGVTVTGTAPRTATPSG